MVARRTWFRCHDCFAVSATLERVSWDKGAACGLCGGRVEQLGMTAPEGTAFLAERCKCDERCTSARGPRCNCSCGGENHGAGLGCTITVVVGQAPVLTPLAHADKHARIGAEYRAALEAAELALQAKYGALLTKFRNREWISDKGTWAAINADLRTLRFARESKTHATRLKILATFTAPAREVA